MPADTRISNLQEVPVTVRYLDANGRTVSVDGPPVWEVNDETLVAVEVAPDGLSAVVRSRGPVGSTFVTVTADAEIGDGTRELVGTFEVEVFEIGAVSVTFEFGDVRDRTA